MNISKSSAPSAPFCTSLTMPERSMTTVWGCHLAVSPFFQNGTTMVTLQDKDRIIYVERATFLSERTLSTPTLTICNPCAPNCFCQRTKCGISN